MKSIAVVSIFFMSSMVLVGQSQLGDLLKKAESATTTQNANSDKGLSDDKITSGLKEALTVGAGKAVALTGKPDGFLKNDAIKIAMPDKLHPVEKGMRMLGQGAQVDELVTAMNRAAEQAAPQAKAIFVNAIKKMSISDARNILTGSDTAATEYFKKTTSSDLTTSFKPIVQKSMANVGVVKKYNTLTEQAANIPFLKKESLSIDDYVVQKSLDGLFYMLGEEEKKIRKNPAAQTTSLLKMVFGKK
jgi:hypothetical protein